MHFGYIGDALETHCRNNGIVKGMYWGCIGDALGTHWEGIEDVSGAHWERITQGTH